MPATPDERDWEAEIIEQNDAGTLFKFLAELEYEVRKEETGELQNCAIRLHNEGQIDFLAPLVGIENGGDFDFFGLQQFYCSIIPELNAEPLEMIDAVSALVRAAGNDLAGGYPNTAIKQWAEKNQNADQVLEALEPLTESNRFYRALFLRAGSDYDFDCFFAVAVEGLSTECEHHRLAAIIALGDMGLADKPESRDIVLEKLLSLVPTANDGESATIVKVIANLFADEDDSFQISMQRALEALARPVQELSVHSVVEIIGRKPSLITESLLVDLASVIDDLDVKNAGTIKGLDYGLSAMIRVGGSQKALWLLEHVVAGQDDSLDLGVFDSFQHAILEKGGDELGVAIVGWLKSGAPQLCELASEMVSSVAGAPMRFSIDFAALKLEDREQVFVCRKAIGYLFFHPVTAASIIISMLRSSYGTLADELVRNLFDPLLLNFSGETRKYVEEVSKDTNDPANASAKKALVLIDEYIDGLRSVGDVAELRPSETERLVERRHHAQKMGTAYKESEKKSVFANLFTRKVLLYGNGSIFTVHAADGKVQKSATKLATHSVSIESPRQLTIDPFDLDMTLRVLRSERLANDTSD